MEIHKVLIATIGVIVGFPAFVGIMSFITWQNGFKMLGLPYITRMILVLVVVVWAMAIIPGGHQ
ncbi:hypothetical protein [Pantoea sp.]|uniref:hypothetical protein n=1 Tax=Pantoea sp. TaxID=69393 RepID=UPI00290C619F|nr:hypothetical protein [Pantoea sp.]MDU4128655.1 hypothetical protein [Pantoea sp.]